MKINIMAQPKDTAETSSMVRLLLIRSNRIISEEQTAGFVPEHMGEGTCKA